MIRRRGLLTLVVGVVVVLAAGRAWGALIGDHAWFDALGFGDVWWWRTNVSLVLKCTAGTVAALVMRAHLEAVRRSFVSLVVPGSVGNLQVNGAVPERTISLTLWACAVAVGVLLTVPVDDWVPLATVLDAHPFGESDPYFQYDLAFWTAWLPLELQAYTWALVSHAVMAMLTIVGYVLTRGIATDGRAVRITRHARRHVTVLGAMLLCLIAWSYRLDGFDRLVNGGGSGTFGFADHRIGLPGGIVMQVVSLAAAAVVTWSAWSAQPRSAIAAVTTVLLMALLLRQGLPLLADSVAGDVDSTTREQRYLETHASYTRRAYESDRVLPADPGDTASLAATPLWDRATVPHATPGQVASLVGWDASAGVPGAYVFDAQRTPGLLPTWHALPVAITSETPFRNVNTRGGVALPPIAVSDSGRGYAIVSDPSHRIAAPSIAATSARLAHAWNQQNLRLLFATVPQPSPVLVTERDVRARLALVAPTLRTGAQVAAVVVADSLLWVAELYAVSATYPLSEHLPFADGAMEVTAAQHAATALVNAHTGRILLVTERNPPALARRPLHRLARHLTMLDRLPDAVRRALPPRADALALEGAVAARFGTRTLRDDAPATRNGGITGYLLVRGAVSDSAVAEDAQVPVWLPMRKAWAHTAAAIDVRGIVRGVLIAPGGGDRRTRWLPSDDAAPYEGVERAARDVSDSLRQPGSLAGAHRGTTRVLPGADAPRFLTPYLTFRDGRPTHLAAVLVTDGIRRGTGVTAPEAALAWREGARAAQPGSAAAALYRQMRTALQRGSWTDFGASFEALGRALGVPPPDSVPR
ncbi:MAG: UPF0182 family protein [Gemmatimonadaceae bacterium]|nr:UPF0182 family protein [Gemmatimonadaceae bacterium]